MSSDPVLTECRDALTPCGLLSVAGLLPRSACEDGLLLSRSATRTDDELVQLRADTIARIDEIQAATEFPAKKISLCGWCEYKDRCPLWATAETLARIEAEETAAKAAAEEAEAEDKSQLSLL